MLFDSNSSLLVFSSGSKRSTLTSKAKAGLYNINYKRASAPPNSLYKGKAKKPACIINYIVRALALPISLRLSLVKFVFFA